jgi:hypothetical protein
MEAPLHHTDQNNCKMHSRCFGIKEGHENFVFNLVAKLSVELGYSFLSLRL